MGRSVFYRPPRSGTIQSVQSLMRINQPPRRSAEMHQVFLISVNVGYCQPSISRECWAALRIKSTTFLVAPPMRWSLPSALSLQNIKAAVSPDCHIERLGQKSQLACIRTLFAPALAGAFFLGTKLAPTSQTLVLQRSKSRCPRPTGSAVWRLLLLHEFRTQLAFSSSRLLKRHPITS